MSCRFALGTALLCAAIGSIFAGFCSAAELPLLWQEARRHGWKARGTTLDGRSYELVAIEGGQPVYYITYNSDAAYLIGVSILHNPAYYSPPLDANSVVIGLWDAGWVEPNHPDLDGRITIIDGTTDANTVYDEHATLVAGTIGGTGSIDPNAKGMAPAVNIRSYNWGMDAAEMAEAAASGPSATNALFLSNHSYGIIAGWQRGVFRAIPGDFNFDDIVDGNDLAVFTDAWLSIPTSSNWNPICDLFPFPDSDEIVNFGDYAVMVSHWLEFLVEENYWFGKWDQREDRNFGRYGFDTAIWDELCYTGPYYLPVKAAGNDRDLADNVPFSNDPNFWYVDPNEPNHPGDPNSGHWLFTVYDANDANLPGDDGWDNGGFDTIPTIATAKNILTVGAVDDTNEMTIFTGWGPADDGRIKPDIVANGFELWSSSTSDANYAEYSGTSAASASAAGAATLLLDFRDALMPYESTRASTVKGLIVHTTTDIGNAGPDYKYGWGLMDANQAADYVWLDFADANGRRIIEGVIAQNTTITYTFTYDGTRPFIRETLCWTDPPATPLGSWDANDVNAADPNTWIIDNNTPMLVNDLDLRVIDTNSQTVYFPYVLDPNDPNSPAVKNNTDNVLDNVEQVYIDPAPPPGIYQVRITSKGEIDGRMQYYSLISSEPIPMRKIWVNDDDDEDRVWYWPDEQVQGPNSSPTEDGTYEHPFDSIQKAIDDANSQDIIVVMDGTYIDVGNYDIDTLGKGVTIRKHWEEPDTVCTVDCRGQGRAFNFRNAETPATRLDGFIIENGRAHDPLWPREPNETDIPEAYGGAIYIKGASPWINDCVIEDCLAHYGGGAIFCDDGANAFISNCDINDNDADSEKDKEKVYYYVSDANVRILGGGMYFRNSSPAIFDCTIRSNFADGSGGGVASNNSYPWLYNCDISKNWCWANSDDIDQFGGGVYGLDSGVHLIDCRIEYNTAIWSGGGVALLGGEYNDDVNSLPSRETIGDVNHVSLIQGCVITRNHCSASGAGVYVLYDDCAAIMDRCLIAKNWGLWSGAASANFGSLLVVDNCTISDNIAGWVRFVGGIEYFSAAGDISNSIIWDNRGIQLEILTEDEWGDIITGWDDPNVAKHLPVNYSDVTVFDVNGVYDPNAWPGEGNISTYPRYADPADDDYHLKTEYENGRWNPATGKFDLTDSVTSPCINSGDPLSDYQSEPAPNGARVNMGCYGNTRHASRSP